MSGAGRFAAVMEHARAGRLVEAEALLREHLERQANDAEALHLLASVAELKGERERAVTFIGRALAAAPDTFVYHAYAAELLLSLGRFERSIEHGTRAAAMRPAAADVQNTLGRAYLELGRYGEAIARFETALSLRPQFAEPHKHIGLALREMGQTQRAVGHFETFNRLAPNAIEGFVNLIDCRPIASSDDTNLRAVEARLANPDGLSADEKTLLGFAAAKAYDDLGRYDEAFRLLLKVNASKRQAIAYDETATLDYFDRIGRAFSADLIRAKSGGGCASAKPIFVVGMPRSGTTLVEQVLASHQKVFGAGERPDLAEVLAAAAPKGSASASFPEFIASSSQADLTRIGETYVERIGRHGRGAARVTDKMVSNFFCIGLIHLALPNAKIIHVMRHAADTCVSCFSRHFKSGVEYSYDLAELGRYYRGYAMLMKHWRDVLPAGAFLDVQYEDVVGDVEVQARRMLAYCGLEWDPRVLSFHLNDRPVKTVSLSQVRQPIYGTSLARWRHYEKHLTPLMRELERPL